MAGLSQALSIAKEALLTHQLSVQVASHNVANVDTPGYTRQSLTLEPNQSSPLAVGEVGGGVRGEEIIRKYDRFMAERIVKQGSIQGGLEAQQESLRIVETIFNEAPGLALNDLLSKFWQNMQELADNPEIVATRQGTFQAAQSVIDHLHSMNSEIIRAQFDIGINLDTGISDINSLTEQIAEINVEITAAERPNVQANDLRDRRDKLVKELSELIDIRYFETNNGTYTVLMADGHALVETNESWDVEWANNELLWLNTNSAGTETNQVVGVGAELGGKIGGWLEVRGNLIEGNPNNYLGRLDAFTNSFIRELNQIHTQGVGLVNFSDDLTSTEVAPNTARLTTPIDSTTAATTIPAGTIKINDREVGKITGAIAVNGLAMAKTDSAVTAINNAVTGVNAKLTTLVAGNAITAAPAAAGDIFDFTVNGVTISYTAVPADVGDASTFAANLVDEINSDIQTYNGLATTPIDLTIEAVVGDGYNGGAINSIVLRNTNAGDESRIIIAGIDPATDPNDTLLELTAGTYSADATHNTGEITLFADEPFTLESGVDDNVLTQLGMGGGNSTTTSFTGNIVTSPAAGPNNITFNLNGTAVAVSVAALASPATIVSTLQTAITIAGENVTVSLDTSGSIVFQNTNTGDNSPIIVDSFTTAAGDGTIFGFTNFTAVAGGVAGDTSAGDGQFTYSYSDGGVATSLHGYKYAQELQTDGGSFDLWIYNSDGTLALPQEVTVSVERAYTLQNIADAINISIDNARGITPATPTWVTATVVDNKLELSPDSNHTFAFANDTSNILQVMGVNTFFSGYSAGSIGVNDAVANNLNNLAAAKVDDRGGFLTGDNSNALLLSNLQQDQTIAFTGTSTTNTLDGFYNSLVGEVGNQGRTVSRNLEFNELVTNQLNELRDATSGVSLDEEMANLIKYQQAFVAASKIITMIDEMFYSLLEVK